MPRIPFQFHWTNQNWKDFESPSPALRSASRKQIRKGGKAQPSAAGGESWSKPRTNFPIEMRSSISYTAQQRAQRSDSPILRLESFFPHIREHFAEHLVVCLALDGSQPMAGSISFPEGQHLYGRYWGCPSITQSSCISNSAVTHRVGDRQGAYPVLKQEPRARIETNGGSYPETTVGIGWEPPWLGAGHYSVWWRNPSASRKSLLPGKDSFKRDS